MTTATASYPSVRAPRGYVAIKEFTVTLLSADLQLNHVTGKWEKIDGSFVGRRPNQAELAGCKFARKFEDMNMVNAPVDAGSKTYSLPEVRVVTVREETTADDALLTRPELILKFFNEVISKSSWFDPEVECFVAIHLNRKNRVKSFTLVTLGTATSTLAHPREVFRAAIVQSATAVICLHNHPSGDPAPSAADVQITRVLRDASKAVDIDLIDHVICGEAKHDPLGRGYYSFRESGVL